MTTRSLMILVILALIRPGSIAAAEPGEAAPSPARPGSASTLDRPPNLSPALSTNALAPAANTRGTGRGGVSLSASLAAQMMSQGDQNGDRKLSREEVAILADAWFGRLDPEKSGHASQEEFLSRFSSLFPTPGTGSRAGGFARGGGGRGGGSGMVHFGALGVLLALDADHDAVMTRAEWDAAFQKYVVAWDRDRNNLLEAEELAAGWSSVLPRTNLTAATGTESQEPIPGLPTPPPSPVLAPAEAMKTIQLVDGFRLELAASEPMIEDPIALSFDEDGRLYVLEMRGFMLDINRSREREPSSRISRLEDTDQDGRYDRATVFADGLVLPRALAAVRGGLLYVSDYKLYFARDTDGDGQADQTELMDADYGGGNVEHAPNGLLTAMDNWIYNAKSATRYRWIRDRMIKEPTEFRGQWGISQDNYGRLIYNVNNSQLLGDFTPPNYLSRNPHYPTSAGLNLFVATDQRVFPIRMNTAINRGFSPEVLDPSGKAYVFASSCSPVIYRGDNFPEEFVGNAFVCDPAVNLIKRNLMFDRNLGLSSRFAYDDREFLAATDERFRPSSLANGPDGALWIVDMYRGISQYGAFMTGYLRRETLARSLDQGIHLGRIYRVVSTRKTPTPGPRLSQESSLGLVRRLSHPNGWIRDTAQRLLVERGDRTVASDLARVVAEGRDRLGSIHALWTLEGLFMTLPAASSDASEPRSKLVRFGMAGANSTLTLTAPTLPPEVWAVCLKAIGDSDVQIQAAAMRVCESLASGDRERQRVLLKVLAALPPQAPDGAQFQAALTAGNLPKPEALTVLARIASQGSQHLLIRDAVVSGLRDWPLQFLQLLLADPEWTTPRPGRAALFTALAGAILTERQPSTIASLLTLAASQNSDQSWRQRSLLEGLTPGAGRSPRRIQFGRAPAALEVLARSNDPQIRRHAERIHALFSWPGHSSEEAPGTPRSASVVSAGDERSIAEGKTLYQQICAGCHGLNGEGLKPLAPPLVQSDWVLGSERRLIRIVLHGLTGPIQVNGAVYEPPAILPEMVPLAVLEDAQIAAVLSYIRRDWGNDAAPISPSEIAAVRRETSAREVPWRQDQLLQVK